MEKGAGLSASSFDSEVIVIGAGVSGCAAAIALRKVGVEVTLVEKSTGPPRRFCGEFVSGEAVDTFRRLDAWGPVEKLGPNPVHRFDLHGPHGGRYSLSLDPAGLGLSRRALDSALLEQAAGRGTRVLQGHDAKQILRDAAGGFSVLIQNGDGNIRSIRARAVIGAYGKRSSLDRSLRRQFFARTSPFVGVKHHYRGVDFGDTIEIYLFPGGYCGLVGIEEGLGNLCMLATQRALEAAGGRPDQLIAAACRGNSALGRRLAGAEPVPDTLMAISRIPFVAKKQVVNGVFMAGDSAGVATPFLGVGVVNGLRSATACAEAVAGMIHQRTDFNAAAKSYEQWWRHSIGRVQPWGYLVSRMFCQAGMARLTMAALARFPPLGRAIYRRTRASMGSAVTRPA